MSPRATTRSGARSPRRLRSASAAVLAVALLLTGCDSPLQVDLPGETVSDELDDPQMAGLLARSVRGDFECAFSRYVWATGQLSAELLGTTGGLTTIPYVQRDVRPVHTGYGEGECDGDGIYTPLSTSRWFADDVFRRIEQFPEGEVPDRTRLLGELALWSGFTRTLFGETFCRVAFDLGPELSPTEVLGQAEEWFTRAIELASQAGDEQTRNAAYVGRARVRLDLGRTSEAAADAREVPEGFTMMVTRSSADGRRENAIYDANNVGASVTVDPQWWDVTWDGAPDPRVQVVDAGRLAGDQQTPLWLQTKYGSLDAPIRLASWVEAQLILAEVEGGQTAVDIINRLHDAAGLTPFASTDEQEIREQVILTREREFFLEGRRMADLRRYPERDFAEVASHGGEHPYQGLPFGTTQCFPIPNAELSANPNIS